MDALVSAMAFWVSRIAKTAGSEESSGGKSGSATVRDSYAVLINRNWSRRAARSDDGSAGAGFAEEARSWSCAILACRYTNAIEKPTTF